MSEKIINCGFQHDTISGGIRVDFRIYYNIVNDKMTISNIELYSDYDSKLPRTRSACIRYNPETNKEQLCIAYKATMRNERNELIRVDRLEWIDSELADDILSRILERAEEERFKFYY